VPFSSQVVFADEVVITLASDARKGLRELESRPRLERYGRNELAADKRIPAWKKFVAQFQDLRQRRFRSYSHETRYQASLRTRPQEANRTLEAFSLRIDTPQDSEFPSYRYG
jgi:hypothetical protein